MVENLQCKEGLLDASAGNEHVPAGLTEAFHRDRRLLSGGAVEDGDVHKGRSQASIGGRVALAR